MLWYSTEAPHQGASNKYHYFFLLRNMIYYVDNPSYLELCIILRKTLLGLAKAGLNSRVVLVLGGLNSKIYCISYFLS